MIPPTQYIGSFSYFLSQILPIFRCVYFIVKGELFNFIQLFTMYIKIAKLGIFESS